jgi:hypothetical protein
VDTILITFLDSLESAFDSESKRAPAGEWVTGGLVGF